MSDQFPVRMILPDVPRIGFDIHICPFPGALFALLKYIDDPCDYDYLMGVTGAAFRRLWNRDDGGNVDLSYYKDAPFQRVFDALGYEWRSYPIEREAMLAGIRESLGRGLPAIAFGIIGPPEAGLVTGYDQDGQVLHGWSYFQEQREQYYEKGDWFQPQEMNWRGLITLGKQIHPRRSYTEVLKGALEWALELAHTVHRPEIADHISGLAAYEAWAAALEVDADYPPDDPKVMEWRAMVYGDQSTMLWERHNAAGFLRQAALEIQSAIEIHSAIEIQAAQGNPGVVEALNAAATLYDQTADMLSILWPWGYSSNNEAIPGLSDPNTRHELVKAVQQAGALEAQAANQLSKALELL